ncbi:MAG TPA: response regulator [Acidobacteria bacterium]|nr:response regulator [Acidobacteriota bacterium]
MHRCTPRCRNPQQDTTILLVDDDPSLRSAMGQFLEDQDWVTLVASDGADALRIVGSYPGPW